MDLRVKGLKENNVQLKKKMEALIKELEKVKKSGVGRKNKKVWANRLRERKGGVTKAGRREKR